VPIFCRKLNGEIPVFRRFQKIDAMLACNGHQAPATCPSTAKNPPDAEIFVAQQAKRVVQSPDLALKYRLPVGPDAAAFMHCFQLMPRMKDGW
jgi:hypothetical protein